MNVALRIEGMTCDHCAETVRRALDSIPGVRAEVSFAEGFAHVDTDGRASQAELVAAVAAAGFSVARSAPTSSAETRRDGDGLHVAIIGSGSGAFAAALRAAERGARVTMIEAGTVGGTCVNVGCVPSKILLRGAHVAHTQREHPFAGVGRTRPPVDRAAMVAQQQTRVAELRRAKYEDLVAANPAIELVRGSGDLTPNAELTAAVNRECHAQGLVTLTCGTYGNVFRFLPPLAASDELLSEGLDLFETAFAKAVG